MLSIPVLNPNQTSLNLFGCIEAVYISYPDKAAERGMTGYITFAKGSITKGVETGKESLPYFEVHVDELDALAREIITRAGMNPQFFVTGFNPFAQGFLNRENKSPLS